MQCFITADGQCYSFWLLSICISLCWFIISHNEYRMKYEEVLSINSVVCGSYLLLHLFEFHTTILTIILYHYHNVLSSSVSGRHAVTSLISMKMTSWRSEYAATLWLPAKYWLRAEQNQRAKGRATLRKTPTPSPTIYMVQWCLSNIQWMNVNLDLSLIQDFGCRSSRF